MQDIQAQRDDREVPLEHVGITRLPLPMRIKEKTGRYQHVSALANLFVEVPPSNKATHLSRLVESLMSWVDKPVGNVDLLHLLEQTRNSAGSFSAEVDFTFGYFLERRAPVTDRPGVMQYECDFRGRLDEKGFEFILGVRVPVTTLCPCSKAISDAGAHNQRSIVACQVAYGNDEFLWLEDLIELIESSGSCPVYPVLKRPDEKYVTEKAYENPKFVEDIVRDVIVALKHEVNDLRWLSVECESQESIHSHNAYAAAQQSIEATDKMNAEVKRFPVPSMQLIRSLR